MLKFSSEFPLQPIAEDEPGPDPSPHPSSPAGGFSDWLSRENVFLLAACIFV